VARELPTPADAIAWIKSAGGVAVLAHPTWATVAGESLDTLLTTLKAQGLGGIEVHYSTHTKRQTMKYLDLAKRLNLLVTGGSDFHGITKPDIEVGIGRGGLKVSEKLLEPLKQAAAQA
jgi:predicted metal-dependent phosphoesterase TrpH